MDHSKKQIAKFVGTLCAITAFFAVIGWIAGYQESKRDMTTCDKPALIFSYEAPEKSFFVYECADNNFRTYKERLFAESEEGF